MGAKRPLAQRDRFEQRQVGASVLPEAAPVRQPVQQPVLTAPAAYRPPPPRAAPVLPRPVASSAQATAWARIGRCREMEAPARGRSSPLRSSRRRPARRRAAALLLLTGAAEAGRQRVGQNLARH